MTTTIPSPKEITAARAQCPGAVVLFRTGDCYWCCGVDAAWLVDLCDLPPDRDTCTFPVDQLDRVLKQLLVAGQRVAICDQVSDVPEDRSLERIVTPGTLPDTSGDDEFQLERQPAQLPRKERFDDRAVEQKKLFAGLGCLRGQTDLPL